MVGERVDGEALEHGTGSSEDRTVTPEARRMLSVMAMPASTVSGVGELVPVVLTEGDDVDAGLVGDLGSSTVARMASA